MDNRERQQVIDSEHLNLLGLFHYITGGLAIAFSALFFFQVLIFRLILSIPELQQELQQAETAPVEAIFGFLQALFGFMILVAVVYGVLLIVSGYFLRARRHRLFSFIVAIPVLVFIPWGTILGVFTMIVLERASVKDLYRKAPSAAL